MLPWILPSVLLVLVVCAIVSVAFTNRERSIVPYLVPARVPRSSVAGGTVAKPLSETATLGPVVTYDLTGFTVEAAAIYADQVYFLASNSDRIFIISGTDPAISVPEPAAGARSISVSDEMVYLTANGRAYSSRLGAPTLLGTPDARKVIGSSVLGSNDGVVSIDVYDRSGNSKNLGLTWFAPSAQFGTAFDVSAEVAVVADGNQVYVFRLQGAVWQLDRSYNEPGVTWVLINRVGGFYIVTASGHASYSDSGRRSDTVSHPGVVRATAGDDGTLVVATREKLIVYRGKNSVSTALDCSRCVALGYSDGRVYCVNDTRRFEINV